MYTQEPLQEWLLYVSMAPNRRSYDQQARSKLRKALKALEQILADAPPGKINYDTMQSVPYGRYFGARLDADDVSRAQGLYRQVWERGGTGSSFQLQELGEMIALALNSASIPFWQELLNLSKPRDRYVIERYTTALAALALLAINQEQAEAYAALTAAIDHRNEQIRSLAIYYLIEAYAVPERPVPAEVQHTLARIARHDRAFVARFQARQSLGYLGMPVPLDHPGGAYHFKVQLRGDPNKAIRTVALRSEQTLADLHRAIQNAFKWDSDHLYSFYMNGQRDDEGFEIRCPEPDFDWGPIVMTIDERGPADVEEGEPAVEIVENEASGVDQDQPDDDDDDPYTTGAVIGKLGLALKHKFIYYFDFGDSHEFDVTVVAIQDQAEPGDYPRLVESIGEAPAQYYSYDDSEWDEEG